MKWYTKIIPTIRAAGSGLASFFTHKDRVEPVDVARAYGPGTPTAQRPERYQYDLKAKDINANVAIAIRSISGAVQSLPIQVIGTEVVGGADRDFVDSEHPANDLLKSPNTEHTLRELTGFLARSYLADGNGIATIERLTGPNERIEVWPRNPKNAEIEIVNGKPKRYKFTYADKTFHYPLNRVVHIRDILPEDPFWGKPRIDPVRVEIEMDYLVNEFNKNFFRNGAALNLMFTPDHDLTDQQHKQLQEAMDADYQGVEKHFKMFINRFGGKIESPDQKHTDIAFLDLLKHDREKIFGVFGLPPFRGGVMEYANYANALAQDKDFWNNTVKQVTAVLEDALNKQLVWPFFGTDVRLAFDYSDVPALRGEPKEQAETFDIYVRNGTLTQNEVREELGKEPLEEDEINPIQPKRGDGEDGPSDGDSDDQAPEPTKDEEEEVEQALRHVFNQQRQSVRKLLTKYVVNGRLMSRLMDPLRDTAEVFHQGDELDRITNSLGPVAASIIRGRDRAALRTPAMVTVGVKSASWSLGAINTETAQMIQGLLSDADQYSWKLPALVKRTNGVFNTDRSKRLARTLARDVARIANGLEVNNLISGGAK